MVGLYFWIILSSAMLETSACIWITKQYSTSALAGPNLSEKTHTLAVSVTIQSGICTPWDRKGRERGDRLEETNQINTHNQTCPSACR